MQHHNVIQVQPPASSLVTFLVAQRLKDLAGEDSVRVPDCFYVTR